MTVTELAPEDLALIEEEEQIFQAVLQAIRDARKHRRINHEMLGQRLEALRDEAAFAKSSDLPALFDQMNTQRALLEHKSDGRLPDSRSPYFAHLCLEEKGKRRDVLLGHGTFLESRRLPLIDWKHAPISRIFFNYREGEEFEEELPGRLAIGTVVKRRVVTIFNGQILRIFTGDRQYRKREDGQWIRESRSFVPLLAGGAGSAKRTLQSGLNLTQTPAPEVSALLDPHQFRLLTADSDDPLLILGGAGCGKTTIALHRAAYLQFRTPHRFPQQKILIVVPEEGLVRLSRKLLDSLGLEQVVVQTFDHWVEEQARRTLRALPDRVSTYVPANVSRVKRHPALLKAFPEIVRRQIEELIAQAERVLPGSQEAFPILRERTEVPMLERFKLAERALIKDAEQHSGHAAPMRIQAVKKFFENYRKRFSNTLGDRADLYTNMEVLQLVQRESQGTITDGMLRDTISHVLDQLGPSADESYGNYDQDALETVDGRSLIDQENEDSLADTLDPEDFAVLLELQYYKTGKELPLQSKLRSYSHMVIDEAQDLAAVELRVLGRALEAEAAITIAGDAAQQIDPTHSFESWEEVLRQLGQPLVHAQHLKTSYRSTKDIAHFAHQILGPIAPPEAPKALRDGLPVARTLFPDEGQMLVFLSEALTELVTNEPLATIALITKSDDTALAFYKLLRDVPKIRLVERGAFDFKPGIEITPVGEVKGLEFDYVIIPDANWGIYIDKPEDRRLLHVAATRAIHQLWVISVGRESILLPPEEE